MNSTNLTYSELLYLYADKFVSDASMLQNKEELPNGRKVSVSKLGNLLAEAAFAYLYLHDFIELKLGKKKALGFIPVTQVLASKKSNNPEDLGKLEKRIFDLSDNLDVHSIMYRLIGEECTVPWAVITQIVKDSLVDKQYLTKEEITKKLIVSYVSYKYHVNSEKAPISESELDDLKKQLTDFSKKDFYKLLVKSINSGINSQKEKPDTDFDD